MEQGLVPFVLLARRALPRQAPPNPEIWFDEELQLWMSPATGRPLVSDYAAPADNSSDLGETVMTRTREGADQTEGVRGSDLGETIVTKTQEGIDTTERAAFLPLEGATIPTSPAASKFGETIITMTHEGRDQGERSRS